MHLDKGHISRDAVIRSRLAHVRTSEHHRRRDQSLPLPGASDNVHLPFQQPETIDPLLLTVVLRDTRQSGATVLN
jgi:hypothetical protein